MGGGPDRRVDRGGPDRCTRVLPTCSRAPRLRRYKVRETGSTRESESFPARLFDGPTSSRVPSFPATLAQQPADRLRAHVVVASPGDCASNPAVCSFARREREREIDSSRSLAFRPRMNSREQDRARCRRAERRTRIEPVAKNAET